VLARQKERGVGRKLVGFEMIGRGIARQGYPALREGREVGRVTSGSHAPFLKRNIGLAYLPVGLTDPGVEFEVGIRARARRERAVVVPTPFYRRPK
jgi:aminomethyltransferase